MASDSTRDIIDRPNRKLGIVTLDPTPTSSYFRQFWQHEGTAVAGSWTWAVDASQTDYSSVRGEGAGEWQNNATHADLDEYKWSNIFLVSGTYKITFVHATGTAHGIVEFLFGSTSLGTVDTYHNPAQNNILDTVTFALTAATMADFRFRVNGNNGASSNFFIEFSRLYIEKIA